MSKKVIIIGSGFGGLGAAARLAAQGYDVELFEKRDKLGGRAYVYEMGGFKFDGGPTVVTAPFMFDDIFELAGRKREDYIEFTALDPFYRIFNHEGRRFDYNDDPDFIKSEIEKWNPADKQGYDDFMSTTKAIFEKGFVQLADQPFLSVGDMLKVVKPQSNETSNGKRVCRPKGGNVKRLMIVLLLFTLLVQGCIVPIQAEAFAGSDARLTLFGQVGGPTISLAVQGDFLYLGYSEQFAVVDITARSNPQLLATLPIPSTTIALAGDYAFVGGHKGFFVVGVRAAASQRSTAQQSYGGTTYQDPANQDPLSQNSETIALRN